MDGYRSQQRLQGPEQCETPPALCMPVSLLYSHVFGIEAV